MTGQSRLFAMWCVACSLFLLSVLSPVVFALDGETADGDYVEVEDRTEWEAGDSVEIYDPETGEYRDADVIDVRRSSNGAQEIELEDERDGEVITVEAESH